MLDQLNLFVGPESIQVDNGPGFTSPALDQWAIIIYIHLNRWSSFRVQLYFIVHDKNKNGQVSCERQSRVIPAEAGIQPYGFPFKAYGNDTLIDFVVYL